MTTRSDHPLANGGCFPLGLIGLTVIALAVYGHVLPQWRANAYYVEGRCLLLDKRSMEEGGVFRSGFLIRHTVDGREYEVWDVPSIRGKPDALARGPKERALAGLSIGEEYPCWYDPDDPSKVVLARGYDSISYLFLFAFVAVACATVVCVLRPPPWGVARPAGSDGGPSSIRGDLRSNRVLLMFCGVLPVLFLIVHHVSGAEWDLALLAAWGLGIVACGVLESSGRGWRRQTAVLLTFCGVFAVLFFTIHRVSGAERPVALIASCGLGILAVGAWGALLDRRVAPRRELPESSLRR